MYKVSFITKNNKLVLLYTCANGRLKYYTGETDLNSPIIEKIKAHIQTQISDYRLAEKSLTKELLKNSLDKLLNKRTRFTQTDFFDKLTAVIDKMESGRILTPGKKKYSRGSIKTYRFTVELLKNFSRGMSLESITLDTYHDFIEWCHAKNFSTNYIGSQIKNWKRLCNLIGDNPFVQSKQFKKIAEETFNIYLTEEEISSLYRFKFVKRLRVAVDWFVIGCYTGLRVSDLSLLNAKNLSEYITIANEKTDEKVVIPVHPLVKEILERWKGLPPAISDQKLNDYIKEAAKEAGFNDDVLFVITKGGKRRDFYLKKWEMISTHSGRRSFITNLRKNGVPDSIVMKLTGIRSAATLKRYDLLSADEAAKIAAGMEFFK